MGTVTDTVQRALEERGPMTARMIAREAFGSTAPSDVKRAGRGCTALMRWGIVRVIGTVPTRSGPVPVYDLMDGPGIMPETIDGPTAEPRWGTVRTAVIRTIEAHGPMTCDEIARVLYPDDPEGHMGSLRGTICHLCAEGALHRVGTAEGARGRVRRLYGRTA